ncbi:MAG: helix-hairpin-helix domain-containing protein [Peptostreptococcaceae bacterium]|nr:helix-hairpin-helix domain-containing protein [Peptostreptococcaceae bacterium]
MRNVVKLIVIAIIVAIGSIISIKNLKDINEGYIVSDIENKNEVYEESKTIDINDNTKDTMQTSKVETSLNDKVTIYISGEVKNPGVVELKYDARLGDGVDLCGGLTEDANLNGINLAMKIKDEGHYIIPKVGEETADTVTNDNEYRNENNTLNEPESNNDNKININTADLSELDSLPGFGQVTAQKIIEYRQEHTKFNSIEELMNIKGIGEKKFNNVKDYIYVQ